MSDVQGKANEQREMERIPFTEAQARRIRTLRRNIDLLQNQLQGHINYLADEYALGENKTPGAEWVLAEDDSAFERPVPPAPPLPPVDNKQTSSSAVGPVEIHTNGAVSEAEMQLAQG